MAECSSPYDLFAFPPWSIDHYKLDDPDNVRTKFESTLFTNLETSYPPMIDDLNPPDVRRPAQDSLTRAHGCLQLPSPVEEEDLDLSQQSVPYKERRREQNRAAQRAFRERKESKLKQQEKQIAELQKSYRSLEKKYNNLRIAHSRLHSGLRVLVNAEAPVTEPWEETDVKTKGSPISDPA